MLPLWSSFFQTSHAAKYRKKGQELDFSWYNYAVSYLQSLLQLNVWLYPESVQKGFVVVVLLFFFETGSLYVIMTVL